MAEDHLGAPRFGRRFWVLIIAIAFPIWIATVYLGFLVGSRGPDLKTLERNVQDVRAAMNVDTVRQTHIQRTMDIIATYNPDMPSAERYDIANEIYRMSVKYNNLDVDLLIATITYESAQTWRPEIVSRAGAIGLMQIMPATGMYVAHYEGINWTDPNEVLQNPIYNIRIGARYLSSMIDLYGLEGGLAAYNGGEKKAAMWLAGGFDDAVLHPETRDYVPAVLKIYEELRG
jgi:soluble lytic murein transglycosylase-like protein